MRSRPTRARELKRHDKMRSRLARRSRPTRARELKPSGRRQKNPSDLSRPTRARELKLLPYTCIHKPQHVAPHAGA